MAHSWAMPVERGGSDSPGHPAHVEMEGCGEGFMCVAWPYGCAPANNESHMVCCSAAQQGEPGIDEYCSNTDKNKVPFCPAGGAKGQGCVRSDKVMPVESDTDPIQILSAQYLGSEHTPEDSTHGVAHEETANSKPTTVKTAVVGKVNAERLQGLAEARSREAEVVAGKQAEVHLPEARVANQSKSSMATDAKVMTELEVGESHTKLIGVVVGAVCAALMVPLIAACIGALFPAAESGRKTE